MHALKFIEKNDHIPDIIIALQATSPIRESKDLEGGLEKFKRGKYDSLFSSCLANDMLFWKKDKEKLKSINYDFRICGSI